MNSNNLNQRKCRIHTNFHGLRLGKNRKDCPSCLAFYRQNKAEGIRETRNRRKSHKPPVLDLSVSETKLPIIDDEKAA